MSVTALLGEALRWARGARVCNKPALFWRKAKLEVRLWRNTPPKHTRKQTHKESFSDREEGEPLPQQRHTMSKNTDPGRHLATVP